MSPDTNEFIIGKNATSGMDHVRMSLGKKKHTSFMGTYRAQFELLAGQKGWDDQQSKTKLMMCLKRAGYKILPSSTAQRNAAAGGWH